MTKATLVIDGKSIIYNGIRYIPDPSVATKLKIYLMRDNHTFMRVYGKTPALVLAKIRSIHRKEPFTSIGSVTLMNDQDKELSRFKFECGTLDALNDYISTKEMRALLKTNTDIYTKPKKEKTV